MTARAREAILGPAPGHSLHPTPAFDASGRLWVAFAEGRAVYVASSPDLGGSFGPAVRVNPAPEAIDANGEGRPKLAISPRGTLLVTWTEKLDKPYSGRIRFSRSTDVGRTFAPPRTLNDDGLVTGHRFDALGVSPRGEVVVAWIDKRDLEAAIARKQAYDGAAIYYATSRDDSLSFGPNRKVRDHACEKSAARAGPGSSSGARRTAGGASALPPPPRRRRTARTIRCWSPTAAAPISRGSPTTRATG